MRFEKRFEFFLGELVTTIRLQRLNDVREPCVVEEHEPVIRDLKLV